MQSSHLQDVQQLFNLKEIPEQISICKIFNHVQAITSWLLLVDMQKIFIEQKLALETGELVFFVCVCVFFSGVAFFFGNYFTDYVCTLITEHFLVYCILIT